MSKLMHRGSGTEDPRRQLTSVSVLLERADLRELMAAHSRPVVVEAVRAVLEAERDRLKSGSRVPSAEELADAVRESLRREEHERLRPVVNATGIILHTGLGRAVLAQRAVDALAGLNCCCNLQIDLETGLRGKRNFMSELLLCRLTGAEAALVVNNNAAATLLILTALCRDKEVVVSRGQLIEIGGSYRLPDCVHQSGAILVEVGTTNKTHLRDYESALTENTGALLRVHPSNYRIVGFTKDVPIEELASLKARQPVLVIDDLGGGALVDLAAYGLPHEPTVHESIAAGADLVCFSGDKLIGGPQAGIVVGKHELIQRIKKHPLTRMLRVDKMTDLALEQTLRLFLEPETLLKHNPTLRMLTAPVEELRRRAEWLKRRLDKADSMLSFRVAETESAMGGGSLPGVPIPSYALAVRSSVCPAQELCRRLRRHEPPIVARVHEDEMLLDLRTVLEGEERILLDALSRL